MKNLYSHYRLTSLFLAGLLLAACSTTSNQHTSLNRPQTGLHLPDKVQFLQTDKRWAYHTLGGSNESLRTDGCLVTASAMALVNLGFKTDPGDLAYRLKAFNGFNAHGWMVWSGLEKATSGIVKTVFYDRKDDGAVRACLAAGYYPLVRFSLKSNRTHWAIVINEDKNGFNIRDPLVNSRTPIALSSRTQSIDAVRCIGVRA